MAGELDRLRAENEALRQAVLERESELAALKAALSACGRTTKASFPEVREVARAWLDGHGLRRVAELAGVDRKTARRYVEAARAARILREGGAGQLDDALIGDALIGDALIGAVVQAVRPSRRYTIAFLRTCHPAALGLRTCPWFLWRTRELNFRG